MKILNIIILVVLGISTHIQLAQINNSKEADTNQKKVVFIIGTGRCGTSCVAGMLNIMGLPLGSDHNYNNDEIQQFNPKGFFEDQETNNLLVSIYNEVMGDGVSWAVANTVNWETLENKSTIMQQVKALLERKLQNTSFFGIKNPKISMLLPVFIDASRELGYEPKIIVVLRSPDEVVASALAWAKEPWENISYVSRRYRYIGICLNSILENTNDCDVLSINYEKVIHHTKDVAHQFQIFLPELREYNEVANKIESFIDESLKHHNMG